MPLHSSAGGGLRTPLSRQGQLRSGWPFGTFSVCSGRRGGEVGQWSLACSALDHPNIVFCMCFRWLLAVLFLEVWIE
jgi:hypothetical protein